MKVLFVFCEGRHEVALLRRLLRKKEGFQRYEQAIKNYPAPLADFLRKRLGERNVDDHRVDQLQGSELPSLAFVARLQGVESILLLFQLGGEKKHVNGRELLGLWGRLMTDGSQFAPSSPASRQQVSTAVIKRWDVGFLLDADSKGPESKLQSIKSHYGQIIPIPETLNHGDWVRGADGERPGVGFFVMCADGQTYGTLEDLLVGWLERSGHRGVFDAANKFLHQNAPAEHEIFGASINDAKSDPVARMAKLNKSALTCVGQYDNPGASLAAFVETGRLLQDEHLASEPACQALLDFLKRGMSL